MIKLTTLNNRIYVHMIEKETLKNVYISYTQFYNLILNENNIITIKNAIQENNEKKYKPRPETVAKLYIKNKKTFLKIATGKNYNEIKTVEDIEDTFEIEIKNYNCLKTIIITDFESYEEYEIINKKIRQLNNTKTQVKNLGDF